MLLLSISVLTLSSLQPWCCGKWPNSLAFKGYFYFTELEKLLGHSLSCLRVEVMFPQNRDTEGVTEKLEEVPGLFLVSIMF